MRPKPCGHPACGISSGVHGYDDGTTDGTRYVKGRYHAAYTFGRGELDEYGFWAIPCGVCAAAYERDHPEVGPCWPFANGQEPG